VISLDDFCLISICLIEKSKVEKNKKNKKQKKQKHEKKKDKDKKIMATPSNRLHQMLENKPMWTCSNPLLGQCQESIYSREMLNEKKIKYWDDEKTCKQKCGLPTDLLNLVLESSGQKERSNFRQLGKSIVPTKFLRETEKENDMRLFHNKLMEQCRQGDAKDFEQFGLIGSRKIDKELLFLLFSAAIENNCIMLFSNLIREIAYGSSVEKPIGDEWIPIIKKAAESKNAQYLNRLVTFSIIEPNMIRKLFENNVSYFFKYLLSRPNSPIFDLLFSSPMLLEELLLKMLIDHTEVVYFENLFGNLKLKIGENYYSLMEATTREDSDMRTREEILELKNQMEELKNSYAVFLKVAPEIVAKDEVAWPSFPYYPSLSREDDREFFQKMFGSSSNFF
jgi:hypothetical protein